VDSHRGRSQAKVQADNPRQGRILCISQVLSRTSRGETTRNSSGLGSSTSSSLNKIRAEQDGPVAQVPVRFHFNRLVRQWLQRTREERQPFRSFLSGGVGRAVQEPGHVCDTWHDESRAEWDTALHLSLSCAQANSTFVSWTLSL
jgi:hypothetical protein